MNFITKHFKKPVEPTSKEIAKASLEEHRCKLLSEQSKAAYHRKMAEYHAEDIARLKRDLELV